MIEPIYAAFKSSSGVTTDTRKIKENSIFFALKGENFNGNDFALQAIENGCSYAIVDERREEFSSIPEIIIVDNVLTCLQELANYHRSKLKIPVVALTGSNGKTTTKELMYAALSAKYSCYATKGNLNNHIGVPLSLLEITNKHEIAIIEMGANHQGEIAQLCQIAEPSLGLITNIGLAHLEGFGGEEGVFRGKKELFDFIISREGTIFVNIDDEKVLRASNSYEGITYGSTDEAIYAGQPKIINSKLHIEWKRSDEDTTHDIKSNLTGLYNHGNIMAAVAVARYFGVQEERLSKAISDYEPTNNRSQLHLTDKNNKLIIDCYNANPNSMSLAIDNLAEMDGKPKIAIIGDMMELGERSAVEHQNIVEQLKSHTNISSVYMVGKQFQKSQGHNFMTFASIQELQEFIEKAQIQNATILLKASRSIRLETILEFL